MLKEFSFKNYLSFKDETVFSMEADLDNVSEYSSDHVVSFGNERILKVASLYGPNGAGKSNLLKAFDFYRKFVIGLDRFMVYGTSEQFEGPMFIKNLDTFKFSENLENVIEFKSFFINSEYEIGYELQIKQLDNDTIVVKYENMSYRNIAEQEFKFLYERDFNETKLDNDFADLLMTKNPSISDTKTFASFIYELYVSQTKDNEGMLKIIYSFMDEIYNMSYYQQDRRLLSKQFFIKSYENERLKNKAVNILNNLGMNILDIIVAEEDNREKTLLVSRTIDGKKYHLDINNESDGTKNLLYILPAIIRKIDKGGLLIIDEIDAHLHPKLTREIIKVFTNKNNQKAQLIFTSHDILNMSNELFRRDEIWFVIKNQNHSSELMALTDFVNYKGEKVRKDAKYSKQYLEGKYGADPFIQRGVYWDVKDS